MPRITIIRANQSYQFPLPDPGYVYLMLMPTGVYKIGCSTDPQRRLKAMRAKFGKGIELIHVISCADYGAAEQALHSKYQHRHIAHERFALTEDDVAAIKAVDRIEL
jgi:predicted GIY-YIG superfamily endonuclease